MTDFQELTSKILARGLTQQQVADAVGCSRSFIAKLHLGAIEEPRYSMAVRLIELEKETRKTL